MTNTDIVAELEGLLQPWREATAAEVEERVARRLVSYGRELADAGPPDAGQSWRVILAAGGIIRQRSSPSAVPGTEHLALVHRLRYDDWCLPKGKVKPGEMLSETALREIREETGCEATLDQFAGIIHYYVRSGPKFVFYWQMTATLVQPLEPNREVDRVEWFTPSAAFDRLTYDLERNFLQRLLRQPEEA